MKQERNGTFRCADGWEVFLALTDSINGIPGPIVCINRARKKSFN